MLILKLTRQLQLTLAGTESNALFNYAIVGFNRISSTIPFRKIEACKKSSIASIYVNTHMRNLK